MNPLKIATAIALTLSVAGCGMFGTTGTGLNSRQRAITVWYEDTDGAVKTRPLVLDQIDNGPAKSLCDLECAKWLQSDN